MIRILALIGCFIAFACVCFAQDVIVTRDSRRINALVTEVNVDDVRFKYFEYPNGSTYMLQKRDIVAILYQNGKVETFETENSRIQPITSAPAQAQNQQATQPVQYQTQNQRDQTVTSSSRVTRTMLNRWNAGHFVGRMRLENPIMYNQYLSHRRKGALGGWMIAGGILTTVAGAAVIGGADDSYMPLGAALIGVGGTSFVTGIVIASKAKQKRNNVLQDFHRSIYDFGETKKDTHIQFNIYGNGLGLAYVF